MSLLTDLISHWELNEASGTRFDSIIASANDLTDVNTVGVATGKIGDAADFNNSNNESLDRATNSLLETGDIDFTIAGWYRVDTTNFQYAVCKWDPAAGQREHQLFYHGSGATDRMRFAVSATGASQSAAVPDTSGPAISGILGTFFFTVVWHDSVANTINIQTNNGGITSVAHSGGVFVSSAKFQLARIQSSIVTANFWSGCIDHLDFYKRLLTTQERSNLYNNGDGLPFSQYGNDLVTPIGGKAHIIGIY